MLAAVGLVALGIAFASRPADARGAAGQAWPPFVLVTGLLLIGLVADEDGAFAAVGAWFTRTSRRPVLRVVAAMGVMVAVTAVLNLDTTAAFLTPVFAHAARRRDAAARSLLIACVLLANGASLFLPGSNLTNLLVLDGHRVSGLEFASTMWAPAAAAAAVTAAVFLDLDGRALRARDRAPDAPAPDAPAPDGPAFDAQASDAPDRPDRGEGGHVRPPARPRLLGPAAALLAAVAVLALREPALPVAAIGAVAVGARLGWRQLAPGRVVEVVGPSTLVGLFGVAVALGTLGRAWSGPASLLGRLDLPATAAIGAVGALVVNNLPAAALLAARPPAHPYALLAGLGVGPNALASGSLAWLLWWRSARLAGVRPPLGRACAVGAVAMPLALASAVAILAAR